MFEPGGRVGKYEVVRELGRGGMGTVFLVKELEDDREFALKIANPEAPAYVHQRFQQEVKVTRRLQDLHLVMAHEAGVYKDGDRPTPYLVMDYLIGETLGDTLEALTERGEAMELADVISIARQVAAGLARAHAKAIIHRDIKPSNIFICRSDAASIVKLIDFGLALIQRETVVEAGTPMLSPPYAPPEQWKSWASVDAAADVYAFGCTLFEMLSGAPPFGVGGELQEAHTTQPPPNVSTIRRTRLPRARGVPKQLAELVEAMLAKAPADRPDLATVRGVLDGLTKRALGAGGGMRRPRAGLLPWVLLVAGVGGLVAIGLAHYLGGTPAPAVPIDGAIDAPVHRPEPPDVLPVPPPPPDAGRPGAIFIEGAGADGPLLGLPADELPTDEEAFRPSAGVRAPATSYWISSHPVTWLELEQTPPLGSTPPHRPAKEGDDMPVRGISWALARDHCARSGGDLPTDEQWEWAARGGGSGGTSPPARAGYSSPRSSADGPWWKRTNPAHAVATDPDDVARTKHGEVRDLLRGVEEWTRDEWRDARTGKSGEFPGYYTTRGFPVATDRLPDPASGVAHRFRLRDVPSTTWRYLHIGFRCTWPG